MQANITPSTSFLHRTNILADTLGCTVKQLAGPMDISWRTIIAGRRDEARVSAKTWRKLEQAEQRAGITTTTRSTPQPDTPPFGQQPGDAFPGQQPGDIPLGQQPHDASSAADARLHDALFPNKAVLAWTTECRDIALSRYPDSAAAAGNELNRLMQLFYAAVDEVLLCAAHARIYERHKRLALAEGKPFSPADLPLSRT